MTDKLTVRPATLDDALYVASNLNEADHAELICVGEPSELVKISHERASQSWVAAEGSEPVTVFGYSFNMNTGKASPWCMSTEKLFNHSWEFIRRSREVVQHWQRQFPMFNYVHEDHKKSIYWLRFCRFTIGGVHVVEGGARFRLFYSEVR